MAAGQLSSPGSYPCSLDGTTASGFTPGPDLQAGSISVCAEGASPREAFLLGGGSARAPLHMGRPSPQRPSEPGLGVRVQSCKLCRPWGVVSHTPPARSYACPCLLSCWLPRVSSSSACSGQRPFCDMCLAEIVPLWLVCSW